MKVYYITSGLQGCYQVRCLQPLQANGWDGDQTSIVPEHHTPEDKARAAKDADVIVFHRPDSNQKLQLARSLKALGKKIVYDNDDTFKDDGGFKLNDLMDEERMKVGLEKINTALDTFIKEADLVTCSTEFLRREYLKLNPNVITIPNCIDPFLFDEPLKNESGKIRIGITGSIALTSDTDICIPIIEHYKNDPRVQFVLFSLPPKGHDETVRKLYSEEYKLWDSVENLEWHPFVNNQDYYTKLNELRLDIVIIPRKDTYFNRCKSNLKFLEASMLEIPVIAQSFPDQMSPYEQDGDDAMHMLLATDTASWIKQIELLMASKKLRRDMGKAAREYVEAKYSIDNNAHRWEDAYKTLFK